MFFKLKNYFLKMKINTKKKKEKRKKDSIFMRSVLHEHRRLPRLGSKASLQAVHAWDS